MVTLTARHDEYMASLGKTNEERALGGMQQLAEQPKFLPVIAEYIACVERALDRQQGKDVPEYQMEDDTYKTMCYLVVGFEENGRKLLVTGAMADTDLPDNILKQLPEPIERSIIETAYAFSREIGRQLTPGQKLRSMLRGIL